jgi:ArsR family transcriptional regulator
MRELERVFKALGDRNRIRILKMLEAKPMCVCEITEILGIAQSSASRHLGLLRDTGLVVDDKDGLWVNYSLSRSTDDIIATILSGLRRWGNEDPRIREDRSRAAEVDRERICARVRSV